MVAERRSDHKVRLYASWNGATEIATWEVLAGPEPGGLESIGSVPSDGFESTIIAGTSEPYVGVRLTPADVVGESFYNDALPAVADGLAHDGVAAVSDGALCVFVEGFNGLSQLDEIAGALAIQDHVEACGQQRFSGAGNFITNCA